MISYWFDLKTFCSFALSRVTNEYTCALLYVILVQENE